MSGRTARSSACSRAASSTSSDDADPSGAGNDRAYTSFCNSLARCRECSARKQSWCGRIFAGRFDPPQWRLKRIPIHAGSVDQPQRVGLQVSPCRGIVVSHPVLVQACFGLEPLAGEAQVDGAAGGDPHPAEGEVAGGPDDGAVCVRRIRGPPYVVSAHIADHPALDHRDGRAVQPDILPEGQVMVACLCRGISMLPSPREPSTGSVLPCTRQISESICVHLG
jgi:hypothetical protein